MISKLPAITTVISAAPTRRVCVARSKCHREAVWDVGIGDLGVLAGKEELAVWNRLVGWAK